MNLVILFQLFFLHFKFEALVSPSVVKDRHSEHYISSNILPTTVGPGIKPVSVEQVSRTLHLTPRLRWAQKGSNGNVCREE